MNVLSAIPAQADLSSVEITSVWDFMQKGDWMMIPIGVCSFIALTVVMERMLSLRRKSIIPDGFLEGVREVLPDTAPASRSAAIEHCRADGSPLANVIAAGIKRLGAPIDRVEHAIEEAGQREALRLRRFVRVLAVIASIAPLLGLLGTIFGMIKAFQTVAISGEALGRTEMLADGIYAAMITTAAGLVVAIPTLVCYHWVTAKIDRLVMEMDQITVDFIDDIAEHAVSSVVVETKSTARQPDLPAVKLAGTGGGS